MGILDLIDGMAFFTKRINIVINEKRLKKLFLRIEIMDIDMDDIDKKATKNLLKNMLLTKSNIKLLDFLIRNKCYCENANSTFEYTDVIKVINSNKSSIVNEVAYIILCEKLVKANLAFKCSYIDGGYSNHYLLKYESIRRLACAIR